jgi:benzoyl-CoA reductase/2-hydroxyglutaryl-CoA dehydratase subunit BcrC/BadD/HgdB
MMPKDQRKRIGFACAYTPLELIDAAGFAPYRVLPTGDAPDRAGQLLHDNICPHVKRILDRAMAGDLPELAGMVFVNSCDAMRRLADAWQQVRPDSKTVLIDLPTTVDDNAVRFFSTEISRLANSLGEWRGRPLTDDELAAGTRRYRDLSDSVQQLREHHSRGCLPGGSVRLQELYNLISTQAFGESIAVLKEALAETEPAVPADDRVPVYVFGNVMAEPGAFDLIESCGARIVAEDFCTGSRLFAADNTAGADDGVAGMAARILARPPCARTFDPQNPGRMGRDLLKQAVAWGGRGVIGHTVKFCDPYLARLPMAQDVLRAEDMPCLLLEGDCTLRSIEQQRTRIEAFIEMLR